MPDVHKVDTHKVKTIPGPVVGVFAPCDPRIDNPSRQRAVNIIRMAAECIAENVKMPDGSPLGVVFSDLLIDGEKEADAVAVAFKNAGVNILVAVPDTWAFPQLTMLSLLAHFPAGIPLNITCGNSGPKPGVVYAHAVNGALAQSGMLSHLNVGSWPDTGSKPKMSVQTQKDLLDWIYAAVTFAGLKGRRVVVFGHDSMGMETALSHIIPTRKTFGLEITRLDMKLLADMLNKKSYNAKELESLYKWVFAAGKDKVEIKTAGDTERLKQSLAMYLITRDLLASLNAVGGGFMSQLEWGSDKRGIPLPVADITESLFNSTFDHNGKKTPMPFATEADMQGLLTMLFFTWLSGGNPPLFMDFRKVWEPWEIQKAASDIGVSFTEGDLWAQKGFVDGNNSGSAAFDWAAKPNTKPADIMRNVWFPLADPGYFPGGGNSAFFVTPGGINGIAGRMAYSSLLDMFTLIWDEAATVDLPSKLSEKVYHTSSPTWPHTYVVPKYASMLEYKQYAPANHFHMTWDLAPARLQYWMDMTNVISATPWQARPQNVPGTDRPQPLMYLINGGEQQTKLLRGKR
ncbi:MAG: hypothetical protein PHC61_03550 [Chitinivibrionales bacterium]|nr:hypothetical protein [Chitinivibrionales bacterium]